MPFIPFFQTETISQSSGRSQPSHIFCFCSHISILSPSFLVERHVHPVVLLSCQLLPFTPRLICISTIIAQGFCDTVSHSSSPHIFHETQFFHKNLHTWPTRSPNALCHRSLETKCSFLHSLQIHPSLSYYTITNKILFSSAHVHCA